MKTNYEICKHPYITVTTTLITFFFIFFFKNFKSIISWYCINFSSLPCKSQMINSSLTASDRLQTFLVACPGLFPFSTSEGAVTWAACPGRTCSHSAPRLPECRVAYSIVPPFNGSLHGMRQQRDESFVLRMYTKNGYRSYVLSTYYFTKYFYL